MVINKSVLYNGGLLPGIILFVEIGLPPRADGAVHAAAERPG